MKLKARILIYLIMLIVYFFAASFLFELSDRLNSNFFITVSFGYTFLNIIYACFVLKWSLLLNIICSFLIAFLSVFLAIKAGEMLLFRTFTENVQTAIFANAIFSIIFWEIVYQVKIRKSK
ncbi:hypothetical protein [uncultured Flavobacterium sp.]|uniref:hypothetical protein n=1 Tax=uncultured Flavobacterium sp. TaxID=165435 RepID=UPI0025FE5AFD|nr:hypothetical protein [uncultured Flavobacterium sp.]